MNQTHSLWPALTQFIGHKAQENTDVRFDAFLGSVEQRAFIMARISTHDDDAALDIVQDSMLRMVQKYASKPETEWPPLFFRILANRLTDHHRKRGFAGMLRWQGVGQTGIPNADENVSEAVDQLPDQSPTPEVTLDSSQINSAVRSALQNLPERQRQVFTLRQWQGLSVAETALALGISIGSVKTHLSRAIQALRIILKEYASNESE